MNDKKRESGHLFILLALALVIIAFGATLGSGYSFEANYRNVSVDTTVNVTSSIPTVTFVIIDSGGGNVTLNAGATRIVTCNATVRDYNGFDNISVVNATFFDGDSSSHSSADDNNGHYTNTSCAQYGAGSGYYANYTCTFATYYYANASANWICNVTASDGIDYGVNYSSSNYNTTEILALYALNVTKLIDYGDLAVGDTSPVQEANVTNYGNQDINVSVYGYGSTPGDGLAMVCDVGDISVDNERYDVNSGTGWAAATQLSGTQTLITGLTIPQQVNDSQQEINSTYWWLYVPPNPFGICNGTVVFQAEASN